MAYFMDNVGNLSIGKRVGLTVGKLLPLAASGLAEKSVDQGEAEGTSFGAVVEENHWPSLIHRRKVSDCGILQCSG